MTEKTKWYKENHISHDGGRWLPISRVEEWAEEK